MQAGTKYLRKKILIENNFRNTNRIPRVSTESPKNRIFKAINLWSIMTLL